MAPVTVAEQPTAEAASARPENGTDEPLFASIRGGIVLIAALSVASSLASVVPFIAIVELARTLWPALDGEPVNAERAWSIVLVAVLTLLVGLAASVASGIVSHFADNDLQLDIRTRIVRHLRALPLGWFGSRSSGSVKKAAENDVSALHQLVGHAIQDAIGALVIPAASLTYLFLVEWRMALASLVPVILTIAFYLLRMSGGTEKFAEYDASVERLNSATIEYVHGIAVVKIFGQTGQSHGRYREETHRFARFYQGWVRETAVMSTLVELVSSPVIVLSYLAVVGSWLTGAGVIDGLDMLPALLLGLGLTAPLLQLGFTSQFLRNAMLARDSLTEFLQQPVVPQPEQAIEPSGSDVELDDVRFGYDDDHTVLHEISAACAPGTVTALVGPSGSGKSTLARLVPRFYDVTEGAVTIGGTDVRRIAADRLYREVGFVFQDPQLLRTSIRDNIRLTRPEASQPEVEQAARAAMIHERIQRLPRGYDTVVGQDAYLSGGEAQRLTIARALLTDAPILVLDEATAFADPDSEAAIQSALSALAAERTILVIAHRLHTISNVDQILVLDEGRIVERGTRQELTRSGGLFQSMWERYEHARSVTAVVEDA